MNEKKETQNPQNFSRYQRFVVFILALLQFTIILDFQIIMPLSDLLMKDLSIDTMQFGLLVSCYAFGAGIMGVLASTVADKFDRKKFLLFFCAGFIMGTLLCGLATSYHLLMVARCVTGIFGGVIASISMSIISDLFKLNQRGRVMSYVQMAFSASQVLGLPVGILIANECGWNVTFFAIVALACVVCLAIVFKFKPITEHQKLQTSENIMKRLWRILSTKSYQTGLLFLTIVSISGAMVMPYIATFLINNVGVKQEQLPLVYICTGIATIIVLPMIGKLSDEMEKRKLFVFGSIFQIVVTLLFTQLVPISLWIVITLNILIFVAMSCCSIPAMALITEIPQSSDRGSYMSLGESLQLMANGIGTIVAGAIIMQPSSVEPLIHFEWLGYVVAIVAVVSMTLLNKISRSIKMSSLLENRLGVTINPSKFE